MAPPRRKQIFYGTFISSKSRNELEFWHDTALYVDEEGKIVKKSKFQRHEFDNEPSVWTCMGWQRDEVDISIAKEGQFFFPGFIDTHVHASQYPNVGIFGKSTLLSWLETYTFPLEASLSSISKAKRVYQACIRKTLSHGTTTAAYYATIDVPATNLLADLCLKYGQRAFVGRVCMDSEKLCPDYYRDESAEEGLRKSKEVIDYIKSQDPKGELVRPIITPRFAPACTAEAMTGLAELAKKEDLPIQTHISENKGEVSLVKDLFPDCESYAHVYDTHSLLTPRTILAHAVHLSSSEADLIAQRQSKISHCPCSNSSLTSGAASVRWMWEKKIEVGLGTDMSGGYSPSILEAARQAALVSRHVAMDGTEENKLTVEEVLYLATRGGAKVVGLEDRLGAFEEGMQFDAQLVGLREVGDREDSDGELGYGPAEDYGNVDVFGWENWEEKMAKWLYGGDDRNTKKVWVGGRLVHTRSS